MPLIGAVAEQQELSVWIHSANKPNQAKRPAHLLEDNL